MKSVKNINSIIFSIFIMIFIEILCIYSMFNIKLSTYKVFSGIVSDKKIVTLIVDSKDLKIINSNKNLFLDNKKYKYDVVLVNRDIMIKDKNKYHEVSIKIGFDKKYDEFELKDFSILDKNIKLIEMFNVIWEDK